MQHNRGKSDPKIRGRKTNKNASTVRKIDTSQDNERSQRNSSTDQIDAAHSVAESCSFDAAGSAVSSLNLHDGDGSDADSAVENCRLFSAERQHANPLASRDEKKPRTMGIHIERPGETALDLEESLARVWRVCLCRMHETDRRAFLVSCSGEMAGVDSLVVTSGRSPSWLKPGDAQFFAEPKEDGFVEEARIRMAVEARKVGKM